MAHEIKASITRTYHIEDDWCVDIEYIHEKEVYLVWLYDVTIAIKIAVAMVEEHQDGINLSFDDVLNDIDEMMHDVEADPRSIYLELFADLWCDGNCDECDFEDCEGCDEDYDHNSISSNIYTNGDNIPNSERVIQFNRKDGPLILF